MKCILRIFKLLALEFQNPRFFWHVRNNFFKSLLTRKLGNFSIINPIERLLNFFKKSSNSFISKKIQKKMLVKNIYIIISKKNSTQQQTRGTPPLLVFQILAIAH
jgi:hypothetical protein